MSAEVLVKVEGVKKKFCRRLRTSLWYGLKDLTAEVFGGSRDHDRLRPEEFWAVNDVSFELRRGECLGLIGRNGAGKTTLLKMLNGLIKPDHGRIEMRGRVGALIALGAGFNPILTGRENIYVNGSVLGLTTREINEKIDEIIDFADLRDFIDSPVQSYSSGMQVRLGFAVATALNPEILLLDEVLAVGDASFRNKCYRRIASIRKKAAVVFVSHNMEQVARTCNRLIVLSNGKVQFAGENGDGISAYNTLNEDRSSEDTPFVSLTPPIEQFNFTTACDQIDLGTPLNLQFQLHSVENLSNFILRLHFYGSSGAFSADGIFGSSASGVSILRGSQKWHLQVSSVNLKPGRYYISAQILGPDRNMLVWCHKTHSVAIQGAAELMIADCQLQLGYWRLLDSADADCSTLVDQLQAKNAVAGVSL